MRLDFCLPAVIAAISITITLVPRVHDGIGLKRKSPR